MAAITVDSSRWPILCARLPASSTDREVQDYLDQLRAFRERREPYALIIEASASRGFSARQRKMQADYIQSGMQLSRVYLRAFAFVADSPFQRGMLTAILWLNPPEWPHRIFRSTGEAIVWTSQMLEHQQRVAQQPAR
ncbi:MAG TPA: hypothetical protein VG963_21910 [Polyangiaceae bacterium]|nr:hypothetical protein [Polyangiaceae bacterium]